MESEFDEFEYADNLNDEKRLDQMDMEEYLRSSLEAQRERIKQLIYNIIPLGEYALTEPVISLNDINKLMEKI